MQMVEPARLARSPGNDTDHDTKEKWHLIKCGSASLTDCQRRYATCELEAMAITWACKKCQYYLEGNQLFTILTDHKPLEAMFKMNLEEVNNTRIHNFREKIAHLRFVVKYTAGRYHMIADALSRAPAPGTFEDDEPPSENFIVRKTMDHYHHIARSDKSLEKIFEAAKNDENYLKMVRDIRRDVDNTEIKKEEDHPGKEFSKDEWSRLSLLEDQDDTLLIFDANRIVIPRSYRREILEGLHISHPQGDTAVGMARDRYFWPHMRRDIINMVGS